MSHLRCAGIGTLGDKRNSKDLLAVLAGHTPSIVVGIHDVLFLSPKQLLAFGTFSHKCWHMPPLGCWYL